MRLLSKKFGSQTNFLAGFLTWTLCLGLTTLSVQHSCNPIIGKPSVECIKIIDREGRDKNSGDKETQPGKNQEEWKGKKKGSGLNDPEPQPDNKILIPVATGAGSGVIAGVGASALASAGVISTTIAVGGAVIATPIAVAVMTGVLVFLAVRSFTGGT